MRIVLTGFMGCGKTTLGKLLADRLGYSFYDTDQMIASELKLTVDQIFTRYGEDFFRRWEREILRSLPAGLSTVIATGGGTLLDEENCVLLREQNSLIIFLKVSPEILWARVQRSYRPLAGDRKRFFQLYKRRSRYYRQIENQLELVGPDIESDLQNLLKFISRRWKKIVQHFSNKRCEIVFLRSLSGPNRDYLHDQFSGRKTFLLSDAWLNSYYRLAEIFPSWQHLSLSGKEKDKNLKTVRIIWQWLLEKQIERDDALLAFGGGVLCDLAGFAGSTILRGIRVAFIPTTLLAMADAAIGGKNGFDFNGYKNMVGTFYLPEKIFIDSTLLITLNFNLMIDGLLEILKAGLLGDQKLLELISRKREHFFRLDLGFLEQIVYRAIKVKLAFLENDLDERKGRRAMLNFGHTFGHALETVSRFRISHGRAVGYGMLFSLLLARRMKILDSLQMKLAAGYLTPWLKPLKPAYSFDDLYNAMGADKKVSQSRKRFVLLSAIGCPQLVSVEENELLRKAYEELLQWPF